MLLIKKVVARFDKKIVAWRKKSTDYRREKSIAVHPEEEPITQDLKKTLSLRTLKGEKPKEDPTTVKPKDNPINEYPQEL